MIAATFQTFRQTYPKGALTTELLMLQHGLYIVRATLADDSQPIVTAMAAHEALDQAEQRAQTKALALLGFTASALEAADGLAPTAPPALAPTEAPPLISATSAAPQPRSTVQPQAASDVNGPDDVLTVVSEVIPEPDVHPLPEALPETLPEALPEEPETDEMPIEQVPELPPGVPALNSAALDQHAPELATFSPDLTAFDTASTDLSDVIAQTDVEMRRLGWTSQQGREHLEGTYHKRSRQQLTDEELLEFLLYLESQPVR
ncbi:MAG: hypothetical protein AAFZ80_06620 [Cyanobacteria bacterium P01_A01_bin.105]